MKQNLKVELHSYVYSVASEIDRYCMLYYCTYIWDLMQIQMAIHIKLTEVLIIVSLAVKTVSFRRLLQKFHSTNKEFFTSEKVLYYEHTSFASF